MCPVPSQPGSELNTKIHAFLTSSQTTKKICEYIIEIKLYAPTVGQLIPSILIAEVDVLRVCEDSDALDDGTNDVKGSDDI